MTSLAGAASTLPVFQLRAVTLDYYFDEPTAPLDTCSSTLWGPLHRVPVLRVFGATPGGQRACLHVHRVFPYFFLRYDDSLPQERDAAHRYLDAFAESLERALKAQRGARGGNEGQQQPGLQHVASVDLVRARPFYGFSAGEALFIRISVIDPRDVRTAAALLASGAVMDNRKVFEPQEAHVPYELQAMMDLNIAGMGLISCSKVVFRGELPKSACAHARVQAARITAGEALVFQTVPDALAGQGSTPLAAQEAALWTSASMLPADWRDAFKKRMSTCELEADVAAEDILNRGQQCTTALQNAKDEDWLVGSLKQLWDDEAARAAATGAPQPKRQQPSPRPLFTHQVASDKEKGVREVLKECAKQLAERKREKAQQGRPPVDASALLHGTQAANSLHALFTRSVLSPSSSGRTVAGPLGRGAPADIAPTDLAPRALRFSQTAGLSSAGDAMADPGPSAVDVDPAAVMPSQYPEEEVDDRGAFQPFSQAPPAVLPLDSEEALLQMQDALLQMPVQVQEQAAADVAEKEEQQAIIATMRPLEKPGEEPPVQQEEDAVMEPPVGTAVLAPPLEGPTQVLTNTAPALPSLPIATLALTVATGPTAAAALAAGDAGLLASLPQSALGGGIGAPKVCFYCGGNCSVGKRSFSSKLGYFHPKCAPDAASDDSEQAARAHKRRRRGTGPSDAAIDDAELMPPPPPPPPGRRVSAAAVPPVPTPASAPVPVQAAPSVPARTVFALRWRLAPPSKADVMKTLSPQVVNYGAFYSKPEDAVQEGAGDNPRPWELELHRAAAASAARLFAPPPPPPAPAELRDSRGVSWWFHRGTVEPSWQALPSGPCIQPHSVIMLLTPARPPPRSSSVRAWLARRRRAHAGQYAAAVDIAPRAEAHIGADSSGDEEDAIVLSASAACEGLTAVNPGRGGGPAQVGLCVGAFGDGGPATADAHAGQRSVGKQSSGGGARRGSTSVGVDGQPITPISLRPASPKWDESLYLQAYQMLDDSAPDAAHAVAPAPQVPAAAPVLDGQGVGRRSSLVGSRPPVGAPSQMTAPSMTHQSTPPSQAGFRAKGAAVAGQPNHVSVASVEVIAATRGTLLPDPQHDAVLVIAMCVFDDSAPPAQAPRQIALVQQPAGHPAPAVRVPGEAEVHVVLNEMELFRAFISLMLALDPDMVMGYDVQGGSLGYLSERYSHLWGPRAVPLLREVSRTPTHDPPGALIVDTYGRDHAAGMWVTGRVVLNLWRIIRAEVKLGSYTFEAVCAAVLRRRVPALPPGQLAAWHASGRDTWRAVHSACARAAGSVALSQQLDLVARTAELARVFGIEFNDVLVRGSQHRVESMMLRLAHGQNYVAFSPTKEQLQSMDAPVDIALVMEPQSGFYTDPVVVLDFQSLYPSMCIAYNLCFSTCIGTLQGATAQELLDGEATRKLGALPRAPHVPPGLLGEDLHVAPNGCVFMPAWKRVGVIKRLLSEILDTRIMVKDALKVAIDRIMQRCLTARQLGLKLIANVTYGYTAANFSGRMPLPELADAIVSSGRATLERAKALIEGTSAWNARVVYSDTDSLFVHLPGRSREEAFRIGSEIAAAVTAANPAPVKLQLEKVYQPCLLVTKKRYVGMAWESAGPDAVPVFDAKGIETVRRDTCGAVSKAMERSLRLLFATRDLSRVKAYLQRQWARIYAGRLALGDAMYAKEVHLGSYAPGRLLPSAAHVAMRSAQVDPRSKPHMGQRVAYVVCEGQLGSQSIADMVHSPGEFVAAKGTLLLNARYYINMQVTALNRLFNLAGGNVVKWAEQTARMQKRDPTKREVERNGVSDAKGKNLVTRWFHPDQCAVCGAKKGEEQEKTMVLCLKCKSSPQQAAAVLGARVHNLSVRVARLNAVCTHCGGADGGLGDVQQMDVGGEGAAGGSVARSGGGKIVCTSHDCPVYLERHKRTLELDAAESIEQRAAADYVPEW